MKRSKRVRETMDSRVYTILTTINRDPYYEEAWSEHSRRKLTSKEGSKNIHWWKRKIIYQFQYREYRTWKYNRKTRWKN
jgi:hypothetical protein